jgi:hypothetical protein
MQPRTLALLVTILPLFAVNLSYIISASAELVPHCIPYIEGCTSISRAARQGEAVFLFRASMIANAVLLMLYWRCAQCWLDTLRIYGAVDQGKKSTQIMFYLGVVGALFLILYASYLGTSGAFYRFMRRYGVILYFTFTPLAQMIMVNQLYKIRKIAPNAEIKLGVLHYQLTILVIILFTGLISLFLSYTQGSSFERENIIEWNFALLITAFFGGSIVMWKNLRYKLSINSGK